MEIKREIEFSFKILRILKISFEISGFEIRESLFISFSLFFFQKLLNGNKKRNRIFILGF